MRRLQPSEMSAVMVLRHNAIILAMQQSFWDRYGIGKMKGVGHPLSGEPLSLTAPLPKELQSFIDKLDQSHS